MLDTGYSMLNQGVLSFYSKKERAGSVKVSHGYDGREQYQKSKFQYPKSKMRKIQIYAQRLSMDSTTYWYNSYIG